MKISLLAGILLLLAITGAAVHAVAQDAKDSPSAIAAKQVIQELVAGQFEKVEALYDARMAAALPPGKLAASWPELIKQAGAFQAITSTQTTQTQGLQVVKMECNFENAVLDATVVFNPDGKLGGLSFRPHQAPAPPWTAPAYANQSLFGEQPLSVVNGKYELPGTLTVPNGDGPFPGVVLVQGSGPEDQDETLGPNKPLKDLAWGLASRGIVVFRYTKRTEKYTVQSSDDPMRLTVEDETISDARAAVALLAKQPKVNPKQVFLLGHSLGAYLAPRIATGDAEIAGIIMLAANARPLEKVVLEQIHYLAAMNGAPTEAEQKNIDAAEAAAKQIESPNFKTGRQDRLLGSDDIRSLLAGPARVRSIEDCRQAEDSNIDLSRWTGLSGDPFEFHGMVGRFGNNKNVTLRSYPDLDHLFMHGSGPSKPSDYARPDHVSAGSGGEHCGVDSAERKAGNAGETVMSGISIR